MYCRIRDVKVFNLFSSNFSVGEFLACSPFMDREKSRGIGHCSETNQICVFNDRNLLLFSH